jgi:carbonic anhydrase
MKYQKAARKAIVAAFSVSVLGALIASPMKTVANEDAPHWAYGGAENPTHWGELSEDFAQCEQGRAQSPINIEQSQNSSPANLEFSYQPTPLAIVNNGHSIQVNYQPGSTVTIDGETYELKQFHFHTPSEHELSGDAAPMELHLVHQNEAGQLAVIGVMMNVDQTDNPTIATIWQNMPQDEGQNAVEGQMVNAANLLPGNKSYYSYTGSLTTPPCSEGVSWTILTEPISVSEDQVETFASLYQVNARPVQPVNSRAVELHQD